MLRMAKKKPAGPPDDEGSAKPTRHGKPLHVWLDPRMRDALDELVRRTRRLLTVEVTIALERHLTEAGLWPPPERHN